MSAPASPARRVAHEALLRVHRDGAYAERVLDAQMTRARLGPRDRALTTELVYGVLRRARWLDFQLGRFAQKPLHKLPDEVHAALRLGAYQLTASRVPASAAVNESVALVGTRFRSLRGVVNAILRRVAVAAEGQLPDPADCIADRTEAMAVRGSLATWIVADIIEQRGQNEAELWVEAMGRVPPLSLRMNTLRASTESLTQAAVAKGASVRPHPGVPHCLEVRGVGPVTELKAFVRGECTVQDPAAALVGHLCSPEPGQVVLDLCAAPGGKTAHLAELMNDRGLVVAVDAHPGRVRLIGDTASRLGIESVRPVCADATDAEALRTALRDHGHEAADLVVVDAPCTSLGTLRRNPELRAQSPDKQTELSVLQHEILATAAHLVRPGGALVYSVCTTTRSEGPDQIARLLKTHQNLRLHQPNETVAPYMEHGPHGPWLRTWTDRHHCDSFFSARLVSR